jgi:hypothetical protein
MMIGMNSAALPSKMEFGVANVENQNRSANTKLFYEPV